MNINKLPNSKIEIISSLPFEALLKHRSKAISHINEHANIDGFRKGHIPEDILVKHVGEMAILQECAEYALAEEYPKILKENNIDAIGRPEIILTKLAKDNPVEFTVRTDVMPEVVLPDYKKIAKETKKEKPEGITEEKIEETIMQIRKSRGNAHVHTEDCDHGHEEEKEGETEIPELNDEFVKSLGKFENVEDFKNKLKENMEAESAHMAKEKRRLSIIEEIIKDAKVEIPEIMIESELDTMLHRFRGDISNMGFAFEDYLKHINKDEEAIRNEWKPDATKRVTLQLAVVEIAKKENLAPTAEEIETELEKILAQYEHADPVHARQYIASVLTNEKVFKFLEEVK